MREIHCSEINEAVERAQRFSPPDGTITEHSITHLLNHHGICEECLDVKRKEQIEIWLHLLAFIGDIETVMESVWVSAFLLGFEAAKIQEEKD